MEFGKINSSQVSEVHFLLPPEPPQNAGVLGGNRVAKPDIRVGCARWGSKEWVGHFYPEHTREKDFLHYYAKLFNCVEVSTTYYRVPSPEQVLFWTKQVPETFRFCPKFPQFITHVMRLQNCGKEVNEFLHSIAHFGENLGPVFLMPHPMMAVKDLPVIKRFIERLPDQLNIFLELRHPSWFINGFNSELYDFLANYGVGLVITDVAGRRDCAHMYLTKKEAFIRFVGNGLHDTDYTRIQQWVNRLQLWINEGIKDVCFFMHQPHEIQSAQLNAFLIDQLNGLPGLHLIPPAIINPPATLFD